jgi:hypothetical protein
MHVHAKAMKTPTQRITHGHRLKRIEFPSLENA